MMRQIIACVFFNAAVLLFLHATCAQAQEMGDTVSRRGAVSEDLYIAGRNVNVFAEVEGDVIAAGANVNVDGNVSADVVAAGGRIDIRGRVGDDLRTAGGEVMIDADVADGLVAAGGSIHVAPRSTIGGRAWLAGGEIDMDGSVAKELKIAAGNIRISGRVAGNAQLNGEHIELLPGARIEGELSYRSPEEIVIHSGAQVTGGITRIAVTSPGEWGAPQTERLSRGMNIAASALLYTSLFVAGVVLCVVFPGFTSGAAEVLRTRSWQSLGLGFALLVATPVGAMVIMATVLGLPVGLVLMCLYIAALPVGFLVGALFVGTTAAHWVRKQPGESIGGRVLSLAGALVLLFLIGMVPVLGALARWLVLIFGLGAGVIQLHRGYAAAR
jgi:cytoskeletal protein CcmA (bactofilin family)